MRDFIKGRGWKFDDYLAVGTITDTQCKLYRDLPSTQHFDNFVLLRHAAAALSPRYASDVYGYNVVMATVSPEIRRLIWC